jgi:hypothetical protein
MHHLHYIIADIRYGTPGKQAYSGTCAVGDLEKNSAKLAANFENSGNQRGLYIPRYAPRSRHDFAVKAKTNAGRVELR